MPAFVFLSGYLSKSVRSQRRKEIDVILWPYIVFETIHFIFTTITGLGYGNINPFMPTYTNWYILALFVWRTLLPYCTCFKPIQSITVVTMVAFMAGFFPVNYLALYRVFFFLPLFIIGYYCEDIHKLLNRLDAKVFVPTFIIAMVAIFVVSMVDSGYCRAIQFAFNTDHAYSLPFDLRKVGLKGLGVVSQIVITLAFMKTCSVLNFDKMGFLQKWGQKSMNIYIAHFLFVLSFCPILIVKLNIINGIILSVILSASICFLLTTKVAEKILRPLVNLKDINI